MQTIVHTRIVARILLRIGNTSTEQLVSGYPLMFTYSQHTGAKRTSIRTGHYPTMLTKPVIAALGTEGLSFARFQISLLDSSALASLISSSIVLITIE